MKSYAVITLLLLSTVLVFFSIAPTVSAESLSYNLQDVTTGQSYKDVFAIEEFIIVAKGTGGIQVYSFNGTDLTLVASNDTAAGTISFVSAYNNSGTIYIFSASDSGVHAYTFDGTSITYKDTDATGTGTAYSVDCNSSYVFGGFANNLTAHSFDGTTLTFLGNRSMTVRGDIWCNETHLFTYRSDTHQTEKLTFDGSSFTLIGDSGVWAHAGGIYVYNNYVYTGDTLSSDNLAVFADTMPGVELDKDLTYTDISGIYVYDADNIFIGTYGDSANPHLAQFSFDGSDLHYVSNESTATGRVDGIDTYLFAIGMNDDLRAYTLDAPPTLENSNPSPANGATAQSLNPTLAINVTHPSGSTMNITWRTNATGTWGDIGTNNTVNNGTYRQTNSSFSEYSTKYWWSVNTTDGTNWDNDTYYFTTEGNTAPTQAGENPADGATGQELAFTWNVTVNDADGDLIDVTIQCSKAAAGGSTWNDHAANSSFQVSISGCAYSTKYFVYVNATDPAGNGGWSNETYNFTTKANTAPVNSDPTPANTATGIAFNPTLYINVTDADGHQMNINWWTNASGSWVNFADSNGVSNGTHSKVTSGMDTLDTKYWWSVNTTDTFNWDNDTYYFTTTDVSEAPVNSNPVPANGATNQPFNIDPFNITIADTQGDTMAVYLWTNATGTWTNWKSITGQSNGTISWVGSHDPYFTDLDPNTKYYWSANTTDSGGNWDNDTYYFTTNHSYSMTVTKTANVSTVETNDSVWDTQLVNYTINVTNTGTGDLTDININETWWNCSCSDWKFWFVSTNEPNWETNLTIYTDSCYMSINITNLSAGESYELYILLNVSECAIDTAVSTLRNWANVTAEYAPAKSSYCDIAWGVTPPVSRDLDVDALAVMIMTFISAMVVVAFIGLLIRWLGEVMR